jgi:hypothetical protein
MVLGPGTKTDELELVVRKGPTDIPGLRIKVGECRAGSE